MSSSKHKLLVIDDSDLIRKAVAMLLENAGYEVEVAAHVAEFDDLLTSWWPDTILTDVQMPDMTGDELCRSLKRRLLVRVVLFSNLPPARLAELAESSGADGYISKLEGFASLPDKLADILRATSSITTSEVPEAGRVILVDDMELGQEVTGTVLAREGFEVRIVANLDEFSKVFATWTPQVILTIPKLTGTEEGEVCQLLKDRMGAKSVPIVFFSDDSSLALSTLAERWGADDGLSKVVGYDKLFKKLRQLCLAS